MRSDGSLVGSRFGPLSAIRPQPRRHHENELWVGTPTRPWGSRRLPATLDAGPARRLLFRSLLRQAEGVPVEFADGSPGIVDEVVFSPLGFDFWPQALVVATPEGRRRVPVASVHRLDVHEPLVRVAADPPPPPAADGRPRQERHRDERRVPRRERRNELVRGMLARRHPERGEKPAGLHGRRGR